MAKMIFASYLVLNCFSLFGCLELEDEFDNGNGAVDARLISADTKFGFKLFAELAEQDTDQNIFVSPLSVSIALTMTYNGAEGETQAAMAETLELHEMDLQEVNQANASLLTELEGLDPEITLNIANSIWARAGREFDPDFLERNRQFFGAQVSILDFSDPKSTEIINQWVDTNTEGRIEKIIEKIDPQMVMFLINAIYFKGTWKVEFDRSRTVDGLFHLLDGRKKQVPMMTRSGGYLHYQGEGFEAIKLPYGQERVYMYIFLPNPNSSLNEFVRDLNAEDWESWMPQFQEVGEDGIIVMPRFKLEYEAVLNEVLKVLGMEVAFDGRANFDGIAPSLFISEVRHKAFVEVNEEGTEAAAVTSVAMAESAGPAPFIFTVDRPFFFAIRDDKMGAVLFMGCVVEP
jgi:serpin B